MARENLLDALNNLESLSKFPAESYPKHQLASLHSQALELAIRTENKTFVKLLLIRIDTYAHQPKESRRKFIEAHLFLGEDQAAFELASRSQDPELNRLVMNRSIDRAVIDPISPSKLLLSSAQISEIHSFHLAFAAYEAKEYETARERLNAIGMASPLMEWKLMLRGLVAYSLSEDAKALDNWSRLKPDRIPYSMVVSMRALIDPSFMEMQSSNSLAKIGMHAKLTVNPYVGTLVQIRSVLMDSEKRFHLFQLINSMVGPSGEQQLPRPLWQKLSRIIYCSIIRDGNHSELSKFIEVFGSPKLDPQFLRLKALVSQKLNRHSEEIKYWIEYEKWLSKNSLLFPKILFSTIRCELLKHIAGLSMEHSDRMLDPTTMIELLRNSIGQIGRIELDVPSPETALKTVLSLMPDDKDALMMMVNFLNSQKRFSEVSPLIARLEEKFPRDLEALNVVETYYASMMDLVGVLSCLRRQVEANPLDRALKNKTARLMLKIARDHVESGNLTECQEILSEIESSKLASDPLILLAALTLRGLLLVKAKKLEEWGVIRTRLFSETNLDASMIFLIGDGTRIKLPKKLLEEFITGFKNNLGALRSIERISRMFDAIAQFVTEEQPYRAMPTHLKLLHETAKVAIRVSQNEQDVVSLCFAIYNCQQYKILKDVSQTAKVYFQTNPYFWFFEAEAIQAPKKSTMVIRTARHSYLTALHLITDDVNAPPEKYLKFKEIWQKRVKSTPEIAILANLEGINIDL